MYSNKIIDMRGENIIKYLNNAFDRYISLLDELFFLQVIIGQLLKEGQRHIIYVTLCKW